MFVTAIQQQQQQINYVWTETLPRGVSTIYNI